MVIGLNVLFLVPNQVGGTEYHTRFFIEDLQKYDQKNYYIIFCNLENYSTFSIPENDRWRKILCPIPAKFRVLRLIYEQTILPLQLVFYSCQVVHSFGYYGPIFTPAVKQVITIHDANWKDHPEDFTFLERIALSVLLWANIKTSTKIVSDSDYSKKRLLNFFPSILDKTRVVRAGVDRKFKKLLSRRLPRLVKGKYLLTVSGFYPHKKIPYLLRLWSKLSPKLKGYKLVLVGQHGKDFPEVENLLSKTANVIWLKKVSFHNLVSYYQHTELVIHPSVYEGFGFPVYEAVACNKRVVVGNKECYHDSITRYLTQLEFYEDKDIEKIISLIKKPPLVAKVDDEVNYHASAQRLIDLYENL